MMWHKGVHVKILYCQCNLEGRSTYRLLLIVHIIPFLVAFQCTKLAHLMHSKLESFANLDLYTIGLKDIRILLYLSTIGLVLN